MTRRARASTFLFEPKRFINDSAVIRMSPPALGAYMLIFCAAWDQEEPGVVPDSDRVLYSMARMSPEEWASVRAEVSLAFDTESRPGWWVQRGLVRTHQAQDKFVKRQSARGEAGAKARWEKPLDGASNANALPPPMLDDGLSSVLGSRFSESPSAPTEPRTLEACDATHRAGAPDSQREAAANLIRSLSAGDDMAKPPPVAPPKQPWRAAVFAVLEGQDAATKAEAFKIAGKMDKGGVCRSPELLAEVIRDWLPKRHRINPFAYYASGGEGFEWMMQRYSRLRADAEAAEHKAEEEQWRHL